MEVVNEAPKKKKINKGIHQSISYNDPAYERKLSMYQMPPTEEVTMDEFEDFAFSRMKGEYCSSLKCHLKQIFSIERD